MRPNKLLLLWSSAGALAVLSWAAVSENVLADWRLAQRRVARALPPGAGFDVQLRQIVVPPLKVVDRCVSCHVGMAPGETALPGDPVAGPHPPVVHDPADYGCTTCHGGQGRATAKADAHGLAPHWPEPMIPKRYAWAGCGTCHSHLEAPSTDLLQRGLAVVERLDCLACHRLDGRGGTLRPGGAGGAEGPDLSRAGARGFRTDWYEQHRKAREEQLAAGRPPGAFPWAASFGAVSPDERATLEAYLRTRAGAPALVEAKALFNSLGCLGCHKVHGVGGDDGPDLTRAGQRDPGRTPFAGVSGPRTIPNWFAEHFRAPARVVPGSPMPALYLSEAQIDRLVLYLLSLRQLETPEAYWPNDRVRALRLREREFASDGASIYRLFCVACHGPKGEGLRYPGMPAFPAVGNPDFLAVASDDFLAATVERGRPGRRMPAWGQTQGGLRPAEIREAVRHLRTLAGGAPAETDARPRLWARPDPSAAALYRRDCAACHGAEGEGAEGPALANSAFLKAATDTYLFETIRRGRRGTTMDGFERGSPARRALSPSEIEALVAHLRAWEEKR